MDPEWQTHNRANWDERVSIHLASPDYDLGPLRAGNAQLHAIEAAEIGDVRGLRILHLQCHFGRDSLILAQMGAADIVGVDFSAPAIEAASTLAAELSLPARFVCKNVYDTDEGLFDLVFVTWGALVWLPDVFAWARVVARSLKPGGRLYLAEGHTAALVMDDDTGSDGRPGWFAPYFEPELVVDDSRDYADPAARLVNTRTHQFMHPIAEVVTAVLAAGMRLDFLHEHPRVPWRMFASLVRDTDGMWTWPDRPWWPLSFSLGATRV